MKELLVFLGLAGMAGAQTPAAPDPRLDARMVVVDAVVRTKSGPITTLTKDDFTLTDKGKQQDIEVFAATPDHDPAPHPPALSPRVGSNRQTRSGDYPQTATVILYDRLNTPVADQAYIRKQVLRILSARKPADRFAFYSLGTTLTVVTDFTDDPTPLIRAAARMNDSAAPAVPADPAEQAMEKTLESALLPVQSLDMVFRVTDTARAFQSITRHLSGLKGRKSVCWITRSFPLTFGADVNRRTELDKELTAATSTLQEENVALYPINPGGAGAGENDRSTTNTPVEGRLMPGANSSISDAGTLSDISTMEDIAKATGGVAYYGINEIDPAVDSVLADAAFSYRLGYYPENKRLDGRAHDLTIKLARKPETVGATVRYRRKYLATKADPRTQTPPIAALAADPLDATAITLAGYAEPDPARPGVQKVHVAVNPSDFHLEHASGHWTGAFDLGIFIPGPAGVTGGTQTINLNLTDAQFNQALSNGMVVDSAIDTRNQPVPLRAVVRDKTSGAAGSVRIPASEQ